MTLTDILDATSIGVRQVAIDTRQPGGGCCRQTWDILSAVNDPALKLLGPARVTCIGIERDGEGEPILYLRIDPRTD